MSFNANVILSSFSLKVLKLGADRLLFPVIFGSSDLNKNHLNKNHLSQLAHPSHISLFYELLN